MLDHWLDRTIADEASYVADPPRARRLIVRQGLLALVAIGALVADGWADGWLGAVAGFLVAWFLGQGLFGAIRRAMVYKRGWLDGRGAMVAAMLEAQQREMRPHEWLKAEMARDYAIMGLPLPEGMEDDEWPDR